MWKKSEVLYECRKLVVTLHQLLPARYLVYHPERMVIRFQLSQESCVSQHMFHRLEDLICFCRERNFFEVFSQQVRDWL